MGLSPPPGQKILSPRARQSGATTRLIDVGAFSLSLNPFKVTHFVANYTPCSQQRTRLRPHLQTCHPDGLHLSTQSKDTHSSNTSSCCRYAYITTYFYLSLTCWGFSTGPLARLGTLKRAALAVRQLWIPLSYPDLQTHKNPEVYLTAVRCSRDPVGPSAHRPNCLSKHNNQQLNWPAYFIATGNTVGLSQLLRWRANNQRPQASTRTRQRTTWLTKRRP